jgi:hypothetical protein
MTGQELQDLLQALLTSASVMLDDPDAEDEEHFIRSVQTFEEARIFTTRGSSSPRATGGSSR